jgi:hypothetical protein
MSEARGAPVNGGRRHGAARPRLAALRRGRASGASCCSASPQTRGRVPSSAAAGNRGPPPRRAPAAAAGCPPRASGCASCRCGASKVSLRDSSLLRTGLRGSAGSRLALRGGRGRRRRPRRAWLSLALAAPARPPLRTPSTSRPTELTLTKLRSNPGAAACLRREQKEDREHAQGKQRSLETEAKGAPDFDRDAQQHLVLPAKKGPLCFERKPKVSRK